MKLDIETWESDKGNREIHHFIEGTNTYVFGINKELLGEIYWTIRELVEEELATIHYRNKFK